MQPFRHTMPHFYKFICIHLQPKRNTHSQIARCSPSIIRSFMSTALIPSMCSTIQEMGFVVILCHAAKSLDNRDFLSWLLDRFDLEEMTIQIGAKQIRVTEHSVKCVLGLPSEGKDPPMMNDDAGKKILVDVAARLFPDQPSPKDIKINPNRATEMINMFSKIGWPNLDEDVCIRIFFMALNNNFLTSNTYCYIRHVDAVWCQDRRAIDCYNWFKIIYEFHLNMSFATNSHRIILLLFIYTTTIIVTLLQKSHYTCRLPTLPHIKSCHFGIVAIVVICIIKIIKFHVLLWNELFRNQWTMNHYNKRPT
jgi:hypothetical protein